MKYWNWLWPKIATVVTLSVAVHFGAEALRYFSNRPNIGDAVAQTRSEFKPCSFRAVSAGRLGEYRSVIEFETETCVRCTYVATTVGSQSSTMSCDFPKERYPLE